VGLHYKLSGVGDDMISERCVPEVLSSARWREIRGRCRGRAEAEAEAGGAEAEIANESTGYAQCTEACHVVAVLILPIHSDPCPIDQQQLDQHFFSKGLLSSLVVVGGGAIMPSGWG
jgi:hypothetical protein